MNIIIDFVTFIFNRIVEILDMIKLPNSLSLLHYFLGAIIIGLIFRLVKGGSIEFEQNTNFLNGRILTGYGARYTNSNNERKQDIVSSVNKDVSYINEREISIQKTFNSMTQSELEDRWRSHGVSEELIRLSRGDD